VNDPGESAACTPIELDPGGFNANATIPYGCTVEHIRTAMQDFLDFLGFINSQLHNEAHPQQAAGYRSLNTQFRSKLRGIRPTLD
jgi:hypothetical protein